MKYHFDNFGISFPFQPVWNEGDSRQGSVFSWRNSIFSNFSKFSKENQVYWSKSWTFRDPSSKISYILSQIQKSQTIPLSRRNSFFNEKIRKRSQNFNQMGCFWVFLPTFSHEIWIFSWDAKSLKNLVLGVIYAYARDHRNQHDVYAQVSRRLLR